VHRLWEPLALKHRPPNGYAGKFSTPYCIAVGLADRRAGLEQFTDERVQDPSLQALASRVRYLVDPANEYPRKFTGHLKITLDDATTLEFEQGYMRGGVEAPLGEAAVETKFRDNVRFGGAADSEAQHLLDALATIADGGPVALGGIR
jgi:2-methylcitrate dehydratase PrpD